MPRLNLRSLQERLRPHPRLPALDPASQVLLLDVDGVLIELPDFFCSRFPAAPVRAFSPTAFSPLPPEKAACWSICPR